MPNRIFIAVPMYGPLFPRFYQKYMTSVSQAARAVAKAGFSDPVPMLTTSMPYVDHADTSIVSSALKQSDWEYLCLVEQDNIVPDDWYDVVVNELDPAVHHVVGRWYFGKAQEDQRSICGYLRANGNFDRLSYEQVQHFRANRGLYRVGAGMEGVDDNAETFVVGLGCTAIHRSVFENWSGKMPWFQSISSWNADTRKIGYLGQDVNFCMEAAKQGFHVWLDTRKASGHIGEFVSDDETYTASAKYAESKGMVNLLTSENVPQTGIPTAMAKGEIDRLSELSVGKVVLEVGTRYGASAIAMAGAGAEIVYTLDWHKGDKWHDAAGANGADTLTQFWLHVNYYGFRDKIVPLVGSTAQILPLLPTQFFDLIFIDGDHSYAGVKSDIQHALRMLKPGGAIVLHDFDREKDGGEPDPNLEFGVTRAAREFLGEPDELVETVAVYHDPARRTVAA